MYWILQENICQEEKWNELVHNLNKLCVPHSIHKVVPFSGDLIPEPYIPPKTPVFCYGSISMGRTAKQKGWYPGVIEVPEFNIQIYNWKENLLNWDCKAYYLWQLADNPNSYYTKFRNDELFFIKPSDDSKFIPGQIMSGKEIKEWANKIVVLGENDGSNVNKDSIVCVSSPKNIQHEARFWIVNNTVVTWSMYKIGSTITHSRQLVDENLIAYAHKFVSLWNPACAYCLDLCRDSKGDVKIVEINNINSSGLYDCDTQKLVNAIDNMKLS